MKKNIVLITVLSFLLPQAAFSAMLYFDPNHSSVVFEATHLGLTKIPGKFGVFEGSIDLNEKDPTKSKIDFTVDVSSINTNVQQRDDHLRSPDFFDAKKYPKATFKSTSIKKAGKNYKLEGDLTIRDVTKKVVFDSQSLGKVADPVMKTDKYVFYGKTQINRKDFGVNYGPNEIVGDKVMLVVSLEAMPNKPEQPAPNQAQPGSTSGGQPGK
ncbi:MAG: YceI-like family protein [Pseudobdellovibrio sp.]|jgi:polyisoprenoid-binding protein YceI|nr:YceI-like family protein [Pseudobdellovibrio sp.]